MVSDQGGLLSGWFFTRVVSHQGGLSSGWSFIRVVSHQGAFTRVVSHQVGLSLGRSHQGGFSSGCPLHVQTSFHRKQFFPSFIVVRTLSLAALLYLVYVCLLAFLI